MRPRLLCWALVPAVFLTGCGSGKKIEQAEVSGKVYYQGKPLPGGAVKFVAEKGYIGTSVIDPEGNYKLEAPVGDVQISVDNRMLNKSVRNRSLKDPAAAHMERPNRPALTPIAGTYVRLPDRYADPAASGLKYTVKSGPQTYNIELSSKPGP